LKFPFATEIIARVIPHPQHSLPKYRLYKHIVGKSLNVDEEIKDTTTGINRSIPKKITFL